jgi:hypothetical protein
MTFFRKSTLVFAASLSFAVAGLVVSSSGARAADVIGAEDQPGQNGFVGSIPGTVGANTALGIQVASDGEAPFHPFGIEFDVSDAIQFNNPGAIPFSVNLWQEVAPGLWALPASLGACGDENEPICEPVGQWFVPGIEIQPGQWSILDAEGNVSDVITLSPTPNGMLLSFASDPLGVPEPAIWAMMLIGFFGVGTMMRRGSNGQKLATA